MKKILLSIIILLISAICYSQFPQKRIITNNQTNAVFEGGAQIMLGLINGVYTDTTAANAGYIDFYNGAQIWTRSDRNFWLRDSVLNMWIRMAKYSDAIRFGVSGEDAMAGQNRTFTGLNNTYSFTFDSVNSFAVRRNDIDRLLINSSSSYLLSPNGTSQFFAGNGILSMNATSSTNYFNVLLDSTLAHKKLSYEGNIHSLFFPYTLVDKSYVDSVHSTIGGVPNLQAVTNVGSQTTNTINVLNNNGGFDTWNLSNNAEAKIANGNLFGWTGDKGYLNLHDEGTGGVFLTTLSSVASQFLFLPDNSGQDKDTLARLYDIRASGGGSQTLQQVFDQQTGEALMNKADTINLAANKLSINGGKTFIDSVLLNAIYDTDGKELLHFYSTASAINHFYMQNAAAGGSVDFGLEGETNLHFSFHLKGTGKYLFYGNTAQETNIGLSEDADNGTSFAFIKAPASLTTDRTATLQDKTGTIAYLSDITDSAAAPSHGVKVAKIVVYPDTSSGSSADDFYTYYTIPANNFSTDGNTVRVEVQYVTTGADTKAVELLIGTVGVSGTTQATTAGYYIQKAVFSRHGSNSAVGRSETWRDLGFQGVTTSDPAIDWTSNVDIKTRINSVNASSIIIQRVEITIEKE